MSHELLAHPADVKFRTEGTTLEDAFSEVVEALAALVDEVIRVSDALGIGTKVASLRPVANNNG